MKFWQCISKLWYDEKVNRKYGEGQWAIQDCWALYLQIWMEKAERVKGWDNG